MASSFTSNAFLLLSFMVFLFFSGALGGITCEDLDQSKCAYAVSSLGTRCVLEKRLRRGGCEEYTCRWSKIEAGGTKDWIESNECVEACGVDRSSVGISSDFLWDTDFIQKLCSDSCYKHCPSIIDLYFNLAAGEGVFLPKMCERQKSMTRRSMAEVALASGPVSFGTLDLAPAPTYSVDLMELSPAPM